VGFWVFVFFFKPPFPTDFPFETNAVFDCGSRRVRLWETLCQLESKPSLKYGSYGKLSAPGLCAWLQLEGHWQVMSATKDPSTGSPVALGDLSHPYSCGVQLDHSQSAS
jgi:hypothetical protein